MEDPRNSDIAIQDRENGHKHSIPPQEDLWISEGPKAGNLAREMMQGSSEEAEYLARTRITESELARDARIMSQYLEFMGVKELPADLPKEVLRAIEAELAGAELPYLLWYKYTGRISLNGEGRKEAVDMITGTHRNMLGRRQPFLERARTMNKEELRTS